MRYSKLNLDIEELKDKYFNNNMSLTEIADIYKVSITTIFKIFKKNNIQLRNPGNFEDLTNKRFGSLIVVEKFKKNKSGKVSWKCLCDCGNYTNSISNLLTNNIKRDCGCSTRIKLKNNKRGWKGFGDISKTYFNKLKANANSRGIEFELTIEYLWDLFLLQDSKCAISGIDIKFARYQDIRRYNQTASLDRIDSSIGYIKGNVQWLHKDINFMKHTLSKKELVKYCRIIIEHQDKTNVKKLD